jgi:hypothetical protein
MPHEPLDIESILEHLASIPSAIREATSALADGDLDRQLEPGEWSVNEILAHLRASATVRGEQRIGRMLTEDEPTIRTISPRRFPGTAEFLGMPFDDSFAAYVAQRDALLDRLRQLRSGDWQRGAVLTGLHTVRRETVQNEASALAQHEAVHLEQIRRLVLHLKEE